MLYHYYMKIKFIFAWAALMALVAVPSLHAQITVVKQDGKKVYLDTSDYNRTLTVGTPFKIILSQEKLTNPKTGKELGLLNHYSESGKIIEVQPLYAIGEMPSSGKYTIGQTAVVETVSVAMPVASAPQPSVSENTTSVSNRKQVAYPVLEYEVVGAVKANLTPAPEEEIAIINTKGAVILYNVEGNTLAEAASYQLTTGYKPLSISAKDMMDTGYEQLFVTVYQTKEQRISTLVFDVQDQEFALKDTLPYFVKTLGCPHDKELYAQKPFISGTRPGDAHELTYKKGHFSLEKDTLRSYGHWLTGINEYEIQDTEHDNFIYTATNGTLRLRLRNGKYIDSPSVFATAPNRIKYKQTIVPLYPSVLVYGPDGNATLAAIQNTTKLGLLSEQFGQYNGGKLHFLRYQNGALKIEETLTLDGFAYDTSCTTRGILIPQVLSSGQTILTEIYR